MKIELYNVGDEEGKKIRDFLVSNNLPFKEITMNNPNDKKSLLKITKSHSINITYGYLEWDLNQLLEHIKKYDPKMGI